VRRNRHDRAGSVGDQHVVGDPDRNLPPVDRVDRVGAGEGSGLFGVVAGAGEFALLGRLVAVGLHFGLAVGGGQLLHQRMLGGEHHVGRAEQRVGTGGVDGDRFAGVGHEVDFRAGGFADPVALHLFDAFRPVESVEVGEQPFGVLGDAEHPLLHRAADHRVAAAFRNAVDDLFIGQHGAERRAPVDRDFVEIGEPLLVEL